MVGFHTKTFLKHDDYMTPKYAWENIQQYIPKDKNLVKFITKQEKLVWEFLLAAFTLGVLAILFKDILLEPGSILTEIDQASVFKTYENPELLDHSSSLMTPYTDIAVFIVEKIKESSKILVNINTAGKGELVKLPSMVPVDYRVNYVLQNLFL